MGYWGIFGDIWNIQDLQMFYAGYSILTYVMAILERIANDDLIVKVLIVAVYCGMYSEILWYCGLINRF